MTNKQKSPKCAVSSLDESTTLLYAAVLENTRSVKDKAAFAREQLEKIEAREQLQLEKIEAREQLQEQEIKTLRAVLLDTTRSAEDKAFAREQLEDIKTLRMSFNEQMMSFRKKEAQDRRAASEHLTAAANLEASNRETVNAIKEKKTLDNATKAWDEFIKELDDKNLDKRKQHAICDAVMRSREGTVSKKSGISVSYVQAKMLIHAIEDCAGSVKIPLTDDVFSLFENATSYAKKIGYTLSELEPNMGNHNIYLVSKYLKEFHELQAQMRAMSEQKLKETTVQTTFCALFNAITTIVKYSEPDAEVSFLSNRQQPDACNIWPNKTIDLVITGRCRMDQNDITLFAAELKKENRQSGEALNQLVEGLSWRKTNDYVYAGLRHAFGAVISRTHVHLYVQKFGKVKRGKTVPLRPIEVCNFKSTSFQSLKMFIWLLIITFYAKKALVEEMEIVEVAGSIKWRLSVSKTAFPGQGVGRKTNKKKDKFAIVLGFHSEANNLQETVAIRVDPLKEDFVPWVEKVVCREEHKELVALYEASARHRNLIQLVSENTLEGEMKHAFLQAKDSQQVLRLKPVGVHPACLVETVSDVVMMCEDILLALQHVHRSGWVHCDVREKNIIRVEEKGNSRFVLLDFECAQKMAENNTAELPKVRDEVIREAVILDDTVPARWRPRYDVNQLFCSTRAALLLVDLRMKAATKVNHTEEATYKKLKDWVCKEEDTFVHDLQQADASQEKALTASAVKFVECEDSWENGPYKIEKQRKRSRKHANGKENTLSSEQNAMKKRK